MAQDSWPSSDHNSRNVTDAEYEEIAARATDDGVYLPADPTSGTVVTAGIGLQAIVKANCWASLRGHAWTSGTTDVTLTIAPNGSAQARTDWVLLRLDRSDWTVRAAIKAGTPGGGTPSITQQTGSTGVYEIPLAYVRVPSGAAAVTVVPYVQYVGGRCRPVTSAAKLPGRRGDMVYETDTGRMLVWTGSDWQLVSQYSGEVNVTGPAQLPWQPQTDSILDVRNGIACLRLGSFQRATGTLAAGTDSRLPCTIPTQYVHPTRDQYATVYVTGLRIGRITIRSGNSGTPGQAFLTAHPEIKKGDSVIGASISWAVS
ncbi:hypothetical protein [Streptomyces sp. NPDC058045]|uniref:hypothetical protein n=1 Tax=Streptomyces sp. NPDC058045 TaxID=3346311 RepID=UPI0036EFEA6F